MQELNNHLTTLLFSFKDYVCTNAAFSDFEFVVDIEKDGSLKLTLSMDDEVHQIKEHVSAWMLFCSKFWGIATKSDDKGILPSIWIWRRPFGPYKKSIFWETKISEALIGIGHELVKLNQKEEAEHCFFAAVARVASSDFDSLLSKVPAQYHVSFKQFKHPEFLKEEFWQGRKAMRKLAGVITLGELLKTYPDHHYQWKVLDKFCTHFIASADFPSDKTGKAIDEMVKETILPLCQSSIGVLKQAATEALEMWNNDMAHLYTRDAKTKDNRYYSERILEYIPILNENGISMSSLFLFEWEALLALSRYEEAEKVWNKYPDYLKQEDILEGAGGHYFYTGDGKDYKAIGLARVALILSRQKKISPLEKDYILRLAKEAHDLVQDRITDKKVKKSKDVFDPLLHHEDIYLALAVTHEINDHHQEALNFYQQANRFRKRHSPSWRQAEVYTKDIERVQEKLKNI